MRPDTARTAPLRRAVRFAAAAALALLPVMTAGPARAATPEALEHCFLDLINAERTAVGAEPLAAEGALGTYGRGHSGAMADQGNLFHSTLEQLEPHLPSGWVAWGENVGTADGTESCNLLHDAFMGSAEHRANVLDPGFDLVGIGVHLTGDALWTTHVFADVAAPPPTTSTTSTTTTTATTSSTTPTTTTATTTAPTATTSTTVAPSTTSEAPDTTATTTTTNSATSTTVPTQTSASVVSTTGAPVVTAAAPPASDGCGADCATTRSNLIALGMVTGVGIAVSWWAFRG